MQPNIEIPLWNGPTFNMIVYTNTHPQMYTRQTQQQQQQKNTRRFNGQLHLKR